MKKTKGPSEKTLQQSLITVLRWIAGVLLILLGLVGCVLPGLQGIAMIIGGLVLLGKKDWVYKMVDIWKRWRGKSASCKKKTP